MATVNTCQVCGAALYRGRSPLRHDVGMNTPSRRRDPLLVVIIAVIVAVALVAVITVVVRGGGTTRDPDSPEGTVERYISALIDRDFPEARSLIDDQLVDNCEYEPGEVNSDQRVSLRNVTITEHTATVDLDITRTSGGPLSGGGYVERSTFTLTDTGDGWLITDAPWQFPACATAGVR